MSIKLISFIVYILVLIIHRYVLSNKKLAFLGAIVAIIYIVGIGTAIIRSDTNLSLYGYIPFILGLILLLVFWMRRREDYHNKVTQRT